MPIKADAQTPEECAARVKQAEFRAEERSVREALEVTPEPPVYLYRNKDEVSGTLSRSPERDEIPLPVTLDERLIVEFYS